MGKKIFQRISLVLFIAITFVANPSLSEAIPPVPIPPRGASCPCSTAMYCPLPKCTECLTTCNKPYTIYNNRGPYCRSLCGIYWDIDCDSTPQLPKCQCHSLCKEYTSTCEGLCAYECYDCKDIPNPPPPLPPGPLVNTSTCPSHDCCFCMEACWGQSGPGRSAACGAVCGTFYNDCYNDCIVENNTNNTS